VSRYVGPSCRQCRREGTKLFLKGVKCLTEKCPVERRAYAPGQHGQAGGRPRKVSEYAKQLREKQKVKRMYGLTERQFRNTFQNVNREPGVKGTNLLVALESRLDNIVYRLGFAGSRKAARQLIVHGHVEVDGRRLDIPAYRVVPGEEVRVAPASRELVAVKVAQEAWTRGQPVSWLSVDQDQAAGRFTQRPTRDAIPTNAQEQLIVELYSK
jgi:small subunit ribosomal protein S4